MTIIEESYWQRNIIANAYYDNFDYRMNISIKKDRINGRFSKPQDNLNQVIKELERFNNGFKKNPKLPIFHWNKRIIYYITRQDKKNIENKSGYEYNQSDAIH